MSQDITNYDGEWWKHHFPHHPQVWPIYTDFKVFLRLVWDHLGLPAPTPVQLDIAEFLQDGPKRGIIMGFRGMGKSYITSAFVCWQLLRSPDMAIMVVSASKIRADDFSTFTKRLIAEMDVLQHLVAKSGQRDSNIAFDVGPAKAKHSPSVKSVGITGQLTGSRANLIVADDIEVPGNSETQTARDKISELVKEFDSVLVPGGRALYLGTPQTEQSLYNRLGERGYTTVIWPAEIPDQEYYDRMEDRLAPFVRAQIASGQPFGTSMDPKRFTTEDLRERLLSYGKSGYSLQFLLDTSLSDALRYPLKLKDLLVTPLDIEKGPASVAWGPTPMNIYNDLFNPGLDGDTIHRPAFTDTHFLPYTGAVMFIDPSGRGADETVWVVAKMLNATVYVTHMGATKDGYEDHVLSRIASDAKTHGVHEILVESNFGQGMFEKLLQPHLSAVGHRCRVEPIRATTMKEKRICDVLEPIMSQHRLVVSEEVLRADDQMVQGYLSEHQHKYRLLYQMSRITREKGALAHDDRLDCLAGAVGYWVESMARGSQEAAERAKEKDMAGLLKEHLKNQIDAVERHRVGGEIKAKRRRLRGSGGFLTLGS